MQFEYDRRLSNENTNNKHVRKCREIDDLSAEYLSIVQKAHMIMTTCWALAFLRLTATCTFDTGS